MNDTKTNDTFQYEKGKQEREKDTKYSKNYKKGKRQGKSGKGRANYHSGKQFNDVTWYKKNPSITSAFVKLPFSFIIGNRFFNCNRDGVKFPVLLSYIVDWCANNRNVDETPTNGYSNKSILDQVATVLYTTMRRNNSGSTNGIEYVDPIISNLLASIDILANAVSNRRVFKLASTYSWKNRLMPSIIFRHLGIDYEDFTANYAAYRGRYNILVAKAKTIKTLANFDFVNAICAQFENVFKDDDTDTGREQMYLAMKGFHHIYDPAGTTNHPGGTVRLMVGKDIGITSGATAEATICTANYDSSSNKISTRKFSVDLDIMEKQINALINDADFNLLQADIEKAFGDQSGYMAIDVVPEEVGPLTPIYSGENALMVKHGVFNRLTSTVSSRVNYPINGTGNIITIRKNHVVNTIFQNHNDETGEVSIGFWHHYYTKETDKVHVPATDAFNMGMDATLYVNPILNVEENDPTEDTIILGTRFQNVYAVDEVDIGTGKYPNVPEDFAPEHIADNAVFCAHVMSNFILYGGMISWCTNDFQGNVGNGEASWSTASLAATTDVGRQHRVLLTNFKYHPMVYLDGGYVCEIGNIRTLTPGELDNIHRNCFLSLWDLPSKTNL